MPVFFNANTKQFERALAAADIDNTTGAFVMSDTSQVWGVVLEKYSAKSADILLHGMATLNLSLAVVGDVTPGLYYLSGITPGKLVRQRPPVGVTVLQVAAEVEDDKHVVLVNTKFHDMLEAHRHYKFTLQVFPAGDHTPPEVGGTHEISNADASIEGWLPADDAIFDDKAPAGAKFGYNLSVSKLKNLWPPVPPEHADLQLFTGGTGEELGGSVPLGEDGLCVVNRYGLWWMSDCYGQVPWDPTFDSNSSLSESLSECPTELERKLLIWFTRPVFDNSATWVASLQAREGSGLMVTCIDTGEDAKTGSLLIDLDLSLTLGATNTPGHIVFKGLANRQFLRGPVVESIKPVGTNLALISNVATGDDGQKYGELQLSVQTDLNAGEINVSVSRLEGVQEQYFNRVLGLGFSAGRNSSMRCKLEVPADLVLPDGTKAKLVLWVLNRSDSAIPANLFALTYRIIPRPTDGPLALPLEASELDLASIPATDVEVTAANQYTELNSEAIAVAAGDILLFDVIRSGATDAFVADVHILKQFGKYVLPS
jgi:hypothetical protein